MSTDLAKKWAAAIAVYANRLAPLTTALPFSALRHTIIGDSNDRRPITRAKSRRPRLLECCKNDQGTVTETNWAGVTVKWDNRSEQAILHNDMAQVEWVPTKIM